jgi:hypothetical protein
MNSVTENSIFEKSTERWQPESISVEIIGNPSPEVVKNIKKRVAGTLNLHNFEGSPPPVAVCEGVVVSASTGEPFIATYDWENNPPTIKIGQGGFKEIWSKVGVDVPDEITAIFVTAHETTHYVQDCEGRLPYKKGNADTIDDPEKHYAEIVEKEAEATAIVVTNEVLGYTYISKN